MTPSPAAPGVYGAFKRIYETDLNDEEWRLLSQVLPPEKPGGRPRSRCLRTIINGIFYMLKTGCQWSMLPRDFQPWGSVYGYFRAWLKAGIWEDISDFLRGVVRIKEGRDVLPTDGIIDSQTTKTSCQAIDCVGFDGGKKIKGRKRHIIVDTIGLPLAVVIHPADIQDRDGARLVFEAVTQKHDLVQRIYADGGYRGERAQTAAGWIDLEIVKRNTEGFSVIRKRWIVERTFAWFTGYRRLKMDFEAYAATTACLIELAMIRLMMRRIWS